MEQISPCAIIAFILFHNGYIRTTSRHQSGFQHPLRLWISPQFTAMIIENNINCDDYCCAFSLSLNILHASDCDSNLSLSIIKLHRFIL
jgi:hypothetical protein